MGVAISEQYLGNVHLESGEREQALQHFEEAYRRFVALGDEVGKISMLYNLGSIQQHQNRYSEALDLFLKGMDMAEESQHKSLQGKGAYLVSVVLVQQHAMTKARSYANQAVALFKAEKNYIELANALESIGVSYLLEKEYKQARKPLLEALAYLDQGDFPIAKAKIYAQLVESYKDEPATQLAYIERGQDIWSKNKLTNIYSISNVGNRGIIYINLYQNDSLRNQMPTQFTLHGTSLLQAAERDLKEAIELAKSAGNQEQLMNFYQAYHRVLAEKGEYKAALEALRHSYAISDTLFSQETKNRIAALESQREIDLRDKQLAIQELEISNARRTRLALTGGSVLLLVIGALLYYQNRQRKNTNVQLLALNTQLDEANKVKTRFFGILSHDLRSPVVQLVHFLRLQQEAPDLLDGMDEQLYREKLGQSAEQVLETMETVLLWSKSQMENFTPQLQDFTLDALFEDVRRQLSGLSAVQWTFQVEEGVSLCSDPDYFRTILYNLSINAYKALEGVPKATVQWWGVKREEYIVLLIKDDGPGMSEAHAATLFNAQGTVGGKSALGLHIVRDLAQAIGCRISVQSEIDEGTSIALTLPLRLDSQGA